MLISELLDPEPSRTWTLVRQAGVTNAVALLIGGEQQRRWLRSSGTAPPPLATDPADRPWSLSAIKALQELYGKHGFTITAIEDTAPMDAIRMNQPGRDEAVDAVIEQIQAMGQCGIGVLCYNWMAASSWSRTVTDVPLRGGALSTGYDHEVASAMEPLIEPGSLTEDELWAGLEYFLRAVIPVAEEAGVTLGLHPDDPPLPVFRGVPRLARSVDAYRRVLDLVPSPRNAVTLCQGNFSLMTDDIPGVIREFGPAGRIAFVHFRDVEGTVTRFTETFHDEGKTDMVACLQAYREVGFAGPLRPDHVPSLDGEDNAKPGYGSLGRLWAFGYIQGMRDAVYHDNILS